MAIPLRLPGFVLLAATGGSLLAQTPIGGPVTGTLAAGVYVTNNSISVPAGQTLTLAAGVIIKFTNGGHDVVVDGTLNTNGTAGNPVVLTAYADDSAGGDTNGNGPSSGGPTAWRGIIFTSPSAGGTLNYLDIRYGGSGFVSNIHLTGASPTLNHCTIRDNYTNGMQCNGNAFPVVANCTFVNNGGYAVDGVPIAAVPGFSNNTATGNAGNGGNYARVTGGGVNTNLTLSPAAMISGAIVVDTPIDVVVGATLTLQPGTVLKWRGAADLTVHGNLVCNGTAASNVVLTALADDSIGGDTNGNGASSGSPTAWRGVIFAPSSTGALGYTDVRYGGSGFVSNIHLIAASPTLHHCIVRNNYTHGMQLNGNSFPVVSNCTFSNNGGDAVNGIPIAALPGFSNNSASGNNLNIGRVTVGSFPGNLTIPAAAMVGGAVSIDTSVSVPAGASLTVQAGTVVKMMGAYDVSIAGALNTTGTAGNPVIFTGFADDSAGGDTNTNGPSSASPTAWRGLIWNGAGSGGTLDWTEVRYGGSGFVSNVHCNDGSPTLRNCTLRDNYTNGMYVSTLARPIVKDCTFTNNGGNAIEGVALAAVPGFTNNTASGNNRNCLHVTDGTVTGALTLSPQSMLTGALMMGSNVSVAAGGSLTVQQGVNFKFDNSYEVVVDGAVRLLGTSYEPVVFTAAADDSIGGDTNTNGPSTGTATAWRGVTIHAGAAASSLENVLIRYTGSGFVPALTCDSPVTTLRSVRADRAYDRGLVIGACAGNPVNLVAWGCGGFGIHATAGGYDLVHATATNNGTGIRRENPWNGSVINSISHGNGTNYANLTAARVLWSDGGFVGSNGNLNVDPLFVAPSQGDLRLQAGSPVLGMADLLQAFFVTKDHDENSRILDDALIGIPLPDMGAFERCAWDMTVTGDSRLGGLVQWTVQGQPGASFYVAGFLNDGVLPLVPYGILLCGSQLGTTVVGLTPVPVLVGQPFALPVPVDPGIVGFEIGIQTLTVPAASAAVGNVTRLHRVQIRP